MINTVSPSQNEQLERARALSSKFKLRATQADKQGALLKEDIADLAASGLLALSLNEAYGGVNASLKDCIEVQLELAKGSGSTALVAAMTIHQVARESELVSWQGDLRDKVFSAVAQGKLINSAASEPRLGSPSRGGLPDTFAEQQGDHLVINGHKNWVTGGEHLSYLLLRLRLGDVAATVLVPNNSAGIRWEKTWVDSLSLRASDSHDLYFENVKVPLTNLFAQKQSPALVWFPMMMAATYFGIALAARDDIIRYALERVPTALGKPIATLPKIQRQIGELDVQLQAARTFLVDTAGDWHKNQDRQPYLARVAAAKHIAVETALEATDKALRIAGGAGIDKGLPFERYLRDVRAGIMHPPSGDAALEVVGKALLNQ